MITPLVLAFLALASRGDAPVTAFTGVDVIPMDKERVLRDQTVLVRDGRIAAVGPTKEVAVPEGAVRIDGKGRYLMPGLADMHVHAWIQDEFALFLANGVTTVRNMFGSPLQLQWRASIAAGELLGPTIYTAGPIIDGEPPVWPGSTVLTDPALAEKVVLEQKEQGYDFLKVYARLTLPCYDALVAAAKKHGMRVMGHVPSAVGLEHVIESHQESIEHLDGLAAAAQAEGSPQIGKISFRTEPNAWPYIDDKKVAELARREIEAGTWNCPTLVVYQKWVTGDERTKSLAGPYMKYVSPLMRSAWGPTEANEKWMSADFVGASHGADPHRMRAVGVLHKAGARILLGTDQANPFVIAGFAVHEELANLVAAGLSPYEALRAGTSGAAEFMHASEEWGTVAVGRRADLLLLEKNPLEAVANAKTPLGVMVRGRWLPRAELDESLEKLAKEYAK